MAPRTRYTKSGETHIAYQVVGEGLRDLVHLPGIFSHIELQWEEPSYARFLERLSSFSRLITLDMRGAGLSDRSAQLPLLEDQMDDVTAVLDAVGSERAVLFGVSQSGPMAALYAATNPRRTEALILYGAYASSQARPDYPWGRSEAWIEEFHDAIDTSWGEGMFLEDVAPSQRDNAAFRRWWGRFERYSSAPGNALAFGRAHTEDDVRDVLSAISVPTLVIQRESDSYRDVGNGRYLASHIPRAQYAELAGSDHLPYVGDQEAVLSEIEEFLTGVRPSVEPQRVLVTVLFTDIVGSTEIVADIGDQEWRSVLDAHLRVAQGVLERYRGRLVNTTGDGLMATFDGPARAIQCADEMREAVKTSASVSAPGCTQARSNFSARTSGHRRAHRGTGRLAGGFGRDPRLANRQGSGGRIRDRVREQRGARPQGRPGRLAVVSRLFLSRRTKRRWSPSAEPVSTRWSQGSRPER